jgi:BirA family biotin operon repressor/biotin-[acetyl-CoA-carboxylase] ligase
VDADRLRAELHGRYATVDVVTSTGSTNRDLAAAARDGAVDRTVLIADEQTAGQGRLARTWTSPPEAGLYLSVLLRLDTVPVARLSWLAPLAGVALVRTARFAGAEAVLKWPNDLLLGPARGKGAGVLAEVGDRSAVVVGIGLNVRTAEGIQPGAGGLPATSLADAGATVLDRTELAVRLLTELADLDDAWRAAGGDPDASDRRADRRRDRPHPRRRTRRTHRRRPGPSGVRGRCGAPAVCLLIRRARKGYRGHHGVPRQRADPG